MDGSSSGRELCCRDVSNGRGRLSGSAGHLRLVLSAAVTAGQLNASIALHSI